MNANATRLLVFFASSLAGASVAHAGSAEKSYREAREILDAGLKAIGGADALKAIKDVRRVGSATAYAQGQSLTPDALVTRQVEVTSALDFAGGRSRTETTTAGAGIVTTRTLAVLNGDQSFGYNLVTRGLTPTAPGGVAAARAAMRRDPAALLLTAMARSETLRALADDTLDGKRQRVVTFSDSDGTQLALYFDAGSGLLSKVETLADNAVLGDAVTETLLSDYRDVPAGSARVKLPFHVVTKVAGDTTQDLKYTTISANAGLANDALAAPKEAINVPPAPPAGGVAVTKLGDDLYFLGGGSHHSLAVGFKDQVVVIEAPLNEDRSLAVLAKVNELFPGKSIRVVATHYHFDHSGGLRTYVAWGLPIVTTPGNKAFIEKMAATPHTIRPDSLSRDPKKPNVETFAKKKVFSDGARTLELHDIGPNPHVGEMVVAYLPKEKVLFVADLLIIVPAGPLAPANPALVDFADKIAKLGLAVDTIAPAHGRLGNMDDLKASLAARPAQD